MGHSKGQTHLLVGQPVEGTREAVHAGGERQVRVREGGTHQMHGVGADIATLVVTGAQDANSQLRVTGCCALPSNAHITCHVNGMPVCTLAYISD